MQCTQPKCTCLSNGICLNLVMHAKRFLNTEYNVSIQAQ